MKIALTGANGFIGSRLARVLASAGHEVVPIDIYPRDDHSKAEFVPCDIRDLATLRARMEACDQVFHLAAAHHDFGISSKTFHDVNVTGLQNLCTISTELGIRDICFYSTVAVFGTARGPLTESTTPAPVSDYGRSKLAAEKVLHKWVESSRSNRALVMRPTVTFGPGNFANMYSLIRQIESGRYFQVGRCVNVKSLSYVENLIDGTLFAWNRADRGKWEIYNYVEKPDFTSRQIAERIYRGLDREPPKWFVPYPAARALAFPLDLVSMLTGKNFSISGARIRKFARDTTQFEAAKIREIGFQPRMSLADGIDAMTEWYLAEGKNRKYVSHLPSEK